MMWDTYGVTESKGNRICNSDRYCQIILGTILHFLQDCMRGLVSHTDLPTEYAVNLDFFITNLLGEKSVLYAV